MTAGTSARIDCWPASTEGQAWGLAILWRSRRLRAMIIRKLGSWASGLVCVLCLVPACWASFTLEEVMSYSFPDHLVAAPKAARVAWVFNQRGARNVWTADAPKFEARAITHYTAD